MLALSTSGIRAMRSFITSSGTRYGLLLLPGAASDAPFELVSISRLFTPPNTRTSHPKIVYPSGLLLAPTQGAPCSSLPLSSPLCVKTTKLLLTYGELDVFAHAWAPSLVEVGRSMLPPDALAPDASDLPLVLRAAEATRRRSASAAQVNELAAPLYAAALAAGGAANGSATQHVVGQRSCRQRGYEVHWNMASTPLMGRRATTRRRCPMQPPRL